MKKVPESQVPGRAAPSYSGCLTLIFVLSALALISVKPSSKTPAIVTEALGFHNRLVALVTFAINYLLSVRYVAKIVVAIYTRHTHTTMSEDALGFARSGGKDIIHWSVSLALFFVAFFEGRYLPDHVGTISRVLLFTFSQMGVSALIAFLLADQVFSRLFGPSEAIQSPNLEDS